MFSSLGFSASSQASREDIKDAEKLVGFTLCISRGGMGVGEHSPCLGLLFCGVSLLVDWGK